MVDFNQPETIAVTPEELVKKIILERLIWVEEAIEEYNKKSLRGYSPYTHIIQARLYTLFNKLRPALKDELIKFNELEGYVKSDKFEKLLKAYNIINAWVYHKQLTNIFKKKVIL